MKNLYIFILLILGAAPDANAQNYIPFPSHAIWLQRHGNGESEPDFYYYGMNGEDTTIGGVTYHKVFRSADTVFQPAECVSALREDMNTRRVYLLDPSASGELILYDFSVSIGDTVGYDMAGNSTPDFITHGIVSSIDSVAIGGVHHRQIHFHQYGSTSEWLFGSWVEGVGNLNAGGLLGPTTMLPTCDCGDKFVCFKSGNSNAWDYHNPEFANIDCSAPPLGIPAISGPSDMDVVVYPNPVTGTSHLELSRRHALKMDIYTITGRLVKSIDVSGSAMDMVLDRRDYTQGCYYYRIYDNTGGSYSGKFVVE